MRAALADSDTLSVLAAAAEGLDLVDHGLRGAGVLAFAGDRGADVIDDDLGALACHRQRDVAADAAAGARDDDDFALHHACITHVLHSCIA
jgi:hypothetical protein